MRLGMSAVSKLEIMRLEEWVQKIKAVKRLLAF
jgi:hypothetical protein